MVERCGALQAYDLRTSNIVLHMVAPAQPAVVYVDPTEIQEVAVNLVVNAK